MHIDAQEVSKLIREAGQKAGLTLEYYNFGALSEFINEIEVEPYVRKRYLYQNVFKQTEKALEEGRKHVNLNIAYLNKIARFIDYKDFNTFMARDQHSAPELEECLGIWNSIVRCNSGLKRILISPVHIFSKENKVWLNLKGPARSYLGELRLKNGCVVCLLDSGEDRELYLTFKLAAAKNPLVLKGTFSGISSGGDAIAGREILVREESISFDELPNRKVDFTELNQNEKLIDPRILNYFKVYEKNYLKVSQVGSFDLDDLLL